MKKIILTCLLMVGFGVNAAPVGGLAPTQGWYWVLDQPGTGLNINIQYGSISDDGFLFGSWYLYNEAGDPLWLVFGGPYQPSSWQEWKETGAIGTFTGPLNLTSGGPAPGAPYTQFQSFPSSYGDITVTFYGRYADITANGDTVRYQTADWANGLDDEGTELYKDSLMDGSWEMKGVLAFRSNSGGNLISCMNIPLVFQQASDKPLLGNPNIPASLDLSPYSLNWTPRTDKYHIGTYYHSGPTINDCFDDSTLPEDSSSFLYVVDEDTNNEYILNWHKFNGGYDLGANSFESASQHAVYKIFYLDRDHAVAIAVASQNQFLGLGQSGIELTPEQLSRSYFLFTRTDQGDSKVLRQERGGTLDDDLPIEDLRIWK